MREPKGSRAAPLPSRWAARTAAAFAVVGMVYGIIESVRVYPVSSWLPVTLYVAALAALSGLVFGVVAGSLARVLTAAVRRPARR